MTITIPTGDLTGVLADVIPFALSDPDMPHVSVIRIEWDGDMLHAEATDALHAARSSWHPDDVGGAGGPASLTNPFGGADNRWALLVAVDEVKEVVNDYKLPKKEAGVPLTLDYESGALTVRRSRDTGHAAKRIILEGRMVDFPPVAVMLDELAEPSPVEEVAYSGAAVARLGQVRQRALTRMRFGARRTHVTIGDRFVAAIAPDRSGERRDEQAELAVAA